MDQDLLLIVYSDWLGVASVRSSSDCKAAVIGGFGRRTAGVEWEVGELLDLLGLSASAKDEETAGEGDTDKDQDDESDKKFHHGWGHGGGGGTRAVSNDESWDDGHLGTRVGGNMNEWINECFWNWVL